MRGIFITFFVAYGGAAAALIRPFIGLLAYICLSILGPENLWSWIVPRHNYVRTVAIALLIGWAVSGFGNWNLGKARGVLYALLGYWAWMIISSFLARNPALSFGQVEATSKTFLPIVVAFTLLDSTAKLRALVWVVVVTNGYLAYEFNVQFYKGEFDPDSFTFLGQDNNGTAINMATVVGMAFFLGIHSEKLWQKLLAFTSAGLMAHVILFSMSRGGMLAMCLAGVVSFLLIRRRPSHYLFFVLAIAIGLRLAGPSVQKEFLSSFAREGERDESASSHITQWKTCLKVIAGNPVVGVGIRNFRYVSGQYNTKYDGLEAHSTWLSVGSEMGIPALCFLLSFYGICWLRLWPLARERCQPADPWNAYIAKMVIASLVGFGVSAQFVTVDGIEMPYFVALIGAGVLKLESMAAENAALERYGLLRPAVC